MGTVGRFVELERFLDSLDKQTYRNFELIIVDQNKDDKVSSIIKNYENKFKILHLKSELGLSKARNVGLKYCQGDIIGFPDDDCYYPQTLLENVAKMFLENVDFDGITGRSADINSGQFESYFHKQSGMIDIFNVWKRATSYTIFLRRSLVLKIGEFDKLLGVGAGTIWGSAEEMDYLIRAIKNCNRIYYQPSIFVNHPVYENIYTEKVVDRNYKYGAGYGGVLRKHQYPIWYVMYVFARPLVASILSFLAGKFKKSKYYYSMFWGRVQGYLKWNRRVGDEK